jgi:transcriptional regulator with PAS, ATPase and Fis domain
LLLGETGTGKGVLARWIHEQSARRANPFVELNCSTLKGELLRSELFGHARGSFTNAIKDRPGLIEAADGGTLFLDEIGEMDLDVQTQLLKTIEEKTFRRIGENRLRSSDFRLVCASNRDLAKEQEKGTFRSDFYFRICVFPITIPSLHQRNEDIPLLTEQLLRESGYNHLPLSKEVVDYLQRCPWKGNIRELRNALERAQLMAGGQPLACHHFIGLQVSPQELAPADSAWNLEEVENQHVLRTLERFNGDKVKASAQLGISLSALYRRLDKLKGQN